ncbi:MAG TPA: FaeA/PapI family transcriptional regulator [Rhodocyclaceae bacterium]
MTASPIFEHIKKHGQVRDADIATALGLKLAKVRSSLTDLSATGKIYCCSVTRFLDGKSVEEILCRVSGYIPPATPGRKPKR